MIIEDEHVKNVKNVKNVAKLSWDHYNLCLTDLYERLIMDLMSTLQ